MWQLANMWSHCALNPLEEISKSGGYNKEGKKSFVYIQKWGVWIWSTQTEGEYKGRLYKCHVHNAPNMALYRDCTIMLQLQEKAQMKLWTRLRQFWKIWMLNMKKTSRWLHRFDLYKESMYERPRLFVLGIQYVESCIRAIILKLDVSSLPPKFDWPKSGFYSFTRCIIIMILSRCPVCLNILCTFPAISSIVL